MLKGDIPQIEETIGYHFKNPKLLEQAFVKPSMTELKGECRNYEILEFIGDSVLGFAVVKKLARCYCHTTYTGELVSSHNEGILTKDKISLIRNTTLAHCLTMLGLDKLIVRGYGHLGADHKTKEGDVAESIIGAVAVDSNWDIDAICSVVDKILRMAPEKTDFVKITEEVCRNLEIQEPRYNLTQENGIYECTALVPNYNVCLKVKNEDPNIAKLYAARDVFLYLRLIQNSKPIDESFIPVLDQIRFVCNYYGYSAPTIKYSKHNGTDSPAKTICEASVKEIDRIFSAQEESQKQARNTALWALLCFLIKADDTRNEYKKAPAENESIRGQGLLKYILSLQLD